MVSRIILSAVLLVALVGSAGVAAAGPPSHAQAGGPSGPSPACDSPSQGFQTSFAASGGESLQPGNNAINPGVINALERNGCEQRLAQLRALAGSQ
jgi:hypothetical protein